MHINQTGLQEEESMGITKLMRTGMTTAGDSVFNIQGSLPARTISAIPSAKDQMIPKGPAYPSPICCCIPADTLHLSRTMTKTPTVTPMANKMNFIKLGFLLKVEFMASSEDMIGFLN